MKVFKIFFAVTGLFLSDPTYSQESASKNSSQTLTEQQLKKLETQGVASSDSSAQESVYAIQDRPVSLINKKELSIGFGYNFTGSGYLTMNQWTGTARYHFSDRYSLGFTYSSCRNKFNTSGEKLISESGLVPDVAYPSTRMSLLLGMNLFYGKIRLGDESVSYFDQYVAFGPGLVNLNRNQSLSAVGDVGFVFWISTFGALRIGVQNEFFKEVRELSSLMVLHAIGHVDIGIIF